MEEVEQMVCPLNAQGQCKNFSCSQTSRLCENEELEQIIGCMRVCKNFNPRRIKSCRRD